MVEACSNYLRAQLDVENCVDIVTIAETYSLDTLRDKVYRFMSENLAVFAQRPEFHRLSANQVHCDNVYCALRFCEMFSWKLPL